MCRVAPLRSRPTPLRFAPRLRLPLPVPLTPPDSRLLCIVAAAHTAECRQNETARVFDEPVRYRFGTFNNNVYPREMYSQMRDFIGRIHNSTFDEVMRRPGNMWAIPGGATSCSPADRQLLLPDSEFMGAFLWCVRGELNLWAGKFGRNSLDLFIFLKRWRDT